MDISRFITCGSVDDGKSTLIGRMLYECGAIYENELKDITDEEINFANLVDGLEDERKQGITIDVAYRYFNYENKKFIIADCPGHEQYTANMVTAASNAQIAIILIDATKGLSMQTKRHSYICALLGIKEIIVAVNKIDLINYDENVFNKIKDDYLKEIANKQSNYYFIPISAKLGDNIVNNSKNTAYFKDLALLQRLKSIEVKNSDDEFYFSVQYVNKVDDKRFYLGQVLSGSLEKNEKLVVLPSKQKVNIKDIIYDFKNVNRAKALEQIAISTNKEVDISRGNILCKNEDKLFLSKKVLADVICFSDIDIKNEVLLKLANQTINAKITKVNYKIDICTLKQSHCDSVKLNDILCCEISLDKELLCKEYKKNNKLGAFILIDKYSNKTIACGMILEQLKQDIEEKRQYTKEEKALNKFIRENYPEWGCISI